MPSTVLSPFQPTHQFDVPDATFLRCLESLRRWTNISTGHQSEKRDADRLYFYGNPIVVIETKADSTVKQPRFVSFRVWGRDLSRGGMSFLVGREALPVQMTDHALPIRADSLFKQAEEVTCGLARPDGTVIWLLSQVLRIRQVHEGLLECGVHFRGRQDQPPG